jgi:hypothetical protein
MSATRKRATKSRKTAAPRRPAVFYARYLKLVLKLPGTEESVSYGTPSVKVKGKILSRLRSEAEGGLALFCDFIDREILLQADPEAFYLTDHYRDYPMILIHLDKVRPDALADLVERAWRMRAPARLVREYDAAAQKDAKR